MHYIRKREHRGHYQNSWLNSFHSFSFGEYYHPQHMGISVLRVINDDRILPASGFAMHGHRDMEIISYITQGELQHKDSMGHTFTLKAGDIQRMSAGSGIMHSEMNSSKEEDAAFFQIWIEPEQKNITPDYQQKNIQQQNITQTQMLTPLVNTQGTQGALSINQNIAMYQLTLSAGEKIVLAPQITQGYLHIIQGNITINDQPFSAGDGLASQQRLNLHCTHKLEALWFDLP